jgi:hypothetical protein
MSCLVYCAISGALIAGNIAVGAQGEDTIKKSRFIESLTPELKKYYEKVVVERRTLYYTGLGWGLVVAAIVSFMQRGKGTRHLHIGCMATAITMGVAYFYYMLMPKHHSMKPHLNTDAQKHAWEMIHNKFKKSYMVGMVLGALAGGFLGAGAGCK